MKVAELIEKLNLKVCAGQSGAENEISGCYIGDLMSLAMTGVQENNVWITIQTNINVVAVSALSGAGCVILADGFMLDENAVHKAESEEMPILSSEMTAYELAKALGELGV